MSYKFEYETQGAATFLVYKKEEQDIIDSMTMGMISNNKIEGVLPFIPVHIDQDTYFKYNVSSQSTLKQYFSSGVKRKRFLKVLDSLLNSLIITEDYMIELSSVILDTEYIFVDTSTDCASIVILPIVGEAEVSVEGFVRNLLLGTKFDQSEDCSYIAALISFLNSTQFFSIDKLKELVQQLLQEKQKVTPNRGESRKVETTIPETPVTQKYEFSQVEKSVPNAVARKAEEAVTPERSTGTSVPVIPKQPVSGEVTGEKKEKKSLFGKKENKVKTGKKDMPAPPPFGGTTTPVEVEQRKVPKKEKPAKKEKKPLFGGKSKPKKGGHSIAIPGMTPKDDRPAVPEKVRMEENGASATTPNQTVIPTQQVELEKHSVQVQDFGQTIDLRSYSQGTTVLTGTTVLVNPVSMKFYIKRLKTNEIFELTRDISRIGLDPTKNDICISGNTAVSREHAIFYRQNDEVYIEDAKSTNGTFVNNEKLQKGGRSEFLHNGDLIILGNEELEIIVKN